MLLSTIALAGASMMGVTFDGTDQSPEYMTGIQQVYAVADSGEELYIPVYSLPYCEEEDETGDPCVWVANVQGDGGGQSFVKLGTEENRIFADVTVWAAEILVTPGAVNPNPVGAVSEAVAPVETVAPVSDPSGNYGLTDEVVQDIQSEVKYDGCVHEDGSGQPGGQDCIWVSSHMGLYDGEKSILFLNGSDPVEMTNAEAHAIWTGVNNN